MRIGVTSCMYTIHTNIRKTVGIYLEFDQYWTNDLRYWQYNAQITVMKQLFFNDLIKKIYLQKIFELTNTRHLYKFLNFNNINAKVRKVSLLVYLFKTVSSRALT